MKHEIPIFIDNTMLLLMEKAGDSMPRVKDETERVIMNLTEATPFGSLTVINHLIKVQLT